MRNVDDYSDGRAIPNNDEIHKNDDYLASKFDTSVPIDFELLKSEIEKNGPLQVSYPDADIKLRLNINPCECTENCIEHEVISLAQISGYTTIITSIDKSKLLACDSFDDFLAKFRAHPMMYYSSSGEQQHYEGEINRHLGLVAMDLYNGKFAYEDIHTLEVLNFMARQSIHALEVILWKFLLGSKADKCLELY